MSTRVHPESDLAKITQLTAGCRRVQCLHATTTGCELGIKLNDIIYALVEQNGCKQAETKNLGEVIFNGVIVKPR